MKSMHLNVKQYRALEKIGNRLIPGDHEYPSFERLGCAEHVDRILNYMPTTDRKDLQLLLQVLAAFPERLIGPTMWLLEILQRIPGRPGALIRTIRIGLRGMVFSLYYSGYSGKNYLGRTPLDLFGYQVRVYTRDLWVSEEASPKTPVRFHPTDEFAALESDIFTKPFSQLSGFRVSK